MDIKRIMTPDPEGVSAKATLRTAAERMRAVDTGALPVMTNGKIEGIITDRDITVRGVAEGKAPSKSTVAEVMTPSVITCNETDAVDRVIAKMKEHKVRRIVVKDRNDAVAGIVSLGDLALATEDKNLSGEVLSAVSS
jgi:CBS domain-containing protein